MTSMDYKSRSTYLKLLATHACCSYIYELTNILFVIKSLKKIPKDLIYPYICSLMNQKLDLLTPSYVTGPQAMPSLLPGNSYLGYPGYETLYIYQSLI